jgi:IS30 family transposase
MGRGKNITMTEVRKIMALRNSGRNASQIAGELGRSSAAVGRIIRMHSVPAKVRTEVTVPDMDMLIVRSSMPDREKLDLLKVFWGVSK